MRLNCLDPKTPTRWGDPFYLPTFQLFAYLPVDTRTEFFPLFLPSDQMRDFISTSAKENVAWRHDHGFSVKMELGLSMLCSRCSCLAFVVFHYQLTQSLPFPSLLNLKHPIYPLPFTASFLLYIGSPPLDDTGHNGTGYLSPLLYFIPPSFSSFYRPFNA